MGGRSGQSTGGGGGGAIGNSFAYTASDANIPIEEMSKINDNYLYIKIPGRDEGTVKNWEKIINAYTNRGYKVNYNIVDSDLKANDIKYIKALNASLDKIKSEKGIFERGMKLRPNSRTEKLVKSMLDNIGKNITMDTFLSTTTSKKTSKNFGTGTGTPVLFTVKGKNGKSVEKLSGYSDEKEYLFKAGSKFKVNSAVKVYDANFSKEIYKISLTEKP